MGDLDVHVTVAAAELGACVDVRELADPLARSHADRLAEQGIDCARVSPLDTTGLTRAVLPGAPGFPGGVAFDCLVVCTDSFPAEWVADWLIELRGGAGLRTVRALFVSGESCGGFAAGLDVARGLIVSGSAGAVLVVTVDRIAEGTRYPPISTTVYSDGAVSCLVTAARPRSASFRLLGSATETWLPGPGRPDGMGAARTLTLAVRAATARVSGGSVRRFRYLVTPNFGRSTRHLLAMAAGMPVDRLHSGEFGRTGHCFASDIPLNLAELEESGALDDGDEILAVTSSRHALSAMALRYGAAG
jgi:3-oxoacyl-[acyl-carrier-protein] synthase III